MILGFFYQIPDYRAGVHIGPRWRYYSTSYIMIRSLVDEEADMITAGITLTLERSKAVKFLPPLIRDIYTFVIQDPGSQATSWTTYVTILSTDLWIAMYLVALGLALFNTTVFALRRKGFLTVSKS